MANMIQIKMFKILLYVKYCLFFFKLPYGSIKATFLNKLHFLAIVS